jgi:hypothetical protein
MVRKTADASAVYYTVTGPSVMPPQQDAMGCYAALCSSCDVHVAHR